MMTSGAFAKSIAASTTSVHSKRNCKSEFALFPEFATDGYSDWIECFAVSSPLTYFRADNWQRNGQRIY